jgi:ATP-dependent DNA ligase
VASLRQVCYPLVELRDQTRRSRHFPDGGAGPDIGEVKFTEWTSEGEMRHPAFLGLRTDKKALDVIREQA